MRFDVDEKGKPVRCYFKKSKDANKLIEEFMLLANKYVAESIGKVKKGQKAKTLPYRIHDQPDPTKLEMLRSFIVKFGYKLKTAGTKGEISRSLNKLMDDCNGKNEQKLIESVGPARHDESQVQHPQHRALRPGLRVLHPTSQAPYAAIPT